MSIEHDIERIDSTLVRHEQRQEKTEDTLIQVAVQLKETATIQEGILRRLEDTTMGLPAAHKRIQSLENIRWKVTGAVTLAVIIWTVLTRGVDLLLPRDKPVTVEQLKMLLQQEQKKP